MDIIINLKEKLPSWVEERLTEILSRLDAIDESLILLINQGASMTADLTTLKNAVAEQKTVDDSIVTLLNQVATQLNTLAQQPSVNPQDLTDLANQISTNNAEIVAAVTANTPAAPAPPTPPTP